MMNLYVIRGFGILKKKLVNVFREKFGINNLLNVAFVEMGK